MKLSSKPEDAGKSEQYKFSEKPTKQSVLMRATIPIRPVILFLAATVFTAVLIEILPYYSKIVKYYYKINDTEKPRQLSYSIHSRDNTEDHLVHVVNVLQKFGYERVELAKDEWNLLWAHDYPFPLFPTLKNLGPHQLVNHFPGSGYLTNKVDLCTTQLPFLPRAFRLPDQKDEFLKYAFEHPDTLFVQKHNEHRYIKINAPTEIALHSNHSFVQEFIQKPFLVDGYKFDIGVYVVITSINPLRVYIYIGDVLFRYCPIKYYPFDSENQDKYVVGDNYLPTWEVPSLRKYYNKFSGSMRAAFEAYVRDQSMDPSKIWPQVENIIRTTILTKEKYIVDILSTYKTHNFFELLRFDLFIDEELKVYLMEANMSPNLSSAHFKPNSLLYEQIIYSVFNLVGIRPVSESANRHTMHSEMVTADKNLAVGLNKCATYNCDKSCNMKACKLCLPCITGTEYKWLQEAHEEHLHRVDMKRIFPQPIHDFQTYDIDIETRNLSKRNAWLSRWFYYKCEHDRTWCL